MILDLTSEELKAVQALDDSYEKLLKETDALILKLRPDDPEPDEKEYERIQASRLPEPTELKPEPIEVRDGTPVYSKEELDAYHNTDEYKAYAEANKRANDAVTLQWDNWYNSGSQKWKEARERYERLQKEYSEALTAFFKKVEDRQFNALGGDLTKILEDARSQVDRIIPNKYQYYEKMREGGSFRARDVRLQADKSFRLDTTETRVSIRQALRRHYEALAEDPSLVKKLDQYIEAALKMSTFVSDDGELFGEVPVQHETTEESSEYLVIRPTKYMTTVDRVSKLAFDNKLTKPVDTDPEALWEVSLEPRKSKNEVIARVAIDYAELLKSGDLSELPEFTSDDYSVLDAIISLRNAGNYAFTKTMLYRVITGKVKGNLEVPPDMSEIIDNALGKFKGIFNLEYTKTDKNGNELTLRLKEPIVTYIIGNGYINGKYVDELIITPRDEAFTPPFEKWARFNGNEIDTRDITLLDVPGLNNGKESRDIKMCLYRRLISMRNTFERVKKSKYELADNQRTIRYDYVYDAIGVSDPDKNKRRLLKDKIDRCMKYWQKKGLIAGYEHKKDKSSGNQYYAVMVSFLEKE